MASPRQKTFTTKSQLCEHLVAYLHIQGTQDIAQFKCYDVQKV